MAYSRSLSGGMVEGVRRAWRMLVGEYPVVLLVLVVGALFWRLAVAGETLFFRDLYAYFLPQKQFFREVVGSGRLPLINPLLNGGQPFLASVSSAALYPANLLFLALPALLAFNLQVVAHLVFAGVGAYACVRQLGADRAAALGSGLVFSLCGISLSTVNLLSFLIAAAWMPWMLMSWNRFLCGREWRCFAVVAALSTVQLMAGAPEISALSLTLLLAWSLAFFRSSAGLRWGLTRWWLLVMGVLGIGAVQILPTAQLVVHASRGEGLASARATVWSLHPLRLAEIVLPGVFGRVDTLRDSDYWGRLLTDGGFPYLLSIYFGAVVVLLMVVGVTASRSVRWISLRQRVVLGGIVVAGFVLALGRHLPGFTTVLDLVPAASVFRFPAKFAVVTVLPAAILAACGVEALFGVREGRTGWRAPLGGAMAGAVGTLGLGGGLGVALALSPNCAAKLFSGVFGLPADATALRGVTTGMAQGWIVLLLFSAVLIAAWRRAAGWHAWAVCGVVALDLMVAGAPLNPTAPPELLLSPPPAAGLVRHELRGGRLFRDETPGQVRLQAPSNEVVWRYRYNLEVMDSDLAAVFGIPVIYHEDLVRMAPVELEAVRGQVLSTPWEDRLPMLSAAGVSLVLSERDIAVPDLQYIASIPTRSVRPLHLYRNLRTARVVELVADVVPASSLEERLAVMSEPGFDPRRQVVLDRMPVQLEAHRTARDLPHPASLHVVVDEASHVAVELSSPWAGIVTLSRTRVPGWQVRVDGVEAELLAANAAFMGVAVTAGHHEVDFRYRPSAVLWGVVVSIFSVIAIVALRPWITRPCAHSAPGES